MPKITIVRPYEFQNQQKKTHIYIDGEKIGSVGINQTAQFEVSAEKHKVELKQKWSGGSNPLEVDLSDNEDRTITMKSFPYNWLFLLLYVSIVPSILITVTGISGFWHRFLLYSIPIIPLLLVYYFLFLKTRFITIQEV